MRDSAALGTACAAKLKSVCNSLQCQTSTRQIVAHSPFIPMCRIYIVPRLFRTYLLCVPIFPGLIGYYGGASDFGFCCVTQGLA